jgi:phosphatidylglycerophosphatase A
VAYWIAVLGGAGLVSRAPGTVGSLASLLLWAPMVMLQVAWPIRLAAVLAVFLLGWWASQHSLKRFRSEDPQAIVIDETAGLGLSLCLCGPSWLMLVLGIALFRFFDIFKPWPVSWADRNVKGSLGIMLDDILAGAYALMFLSLAEIIL